MRNQKNNCVIVTPEMVDQLIEEYYSSDVQRAETLLQSIALVREAEVDVDRIVTDMISERKKLADNVSWYEDELVKMMDLSAVILEHCNTGTAFDKEPYISYLLGKNLTLLPDIIEMIQLLKK